MVEEGALGMKRSTWVVIGILLAASMTSLLVWRPWEMTREQWIREAKLQLRTVPPPPAHLANSLGPEQWARDGYLLFTNGWARMVSHTFHDSERVGDVAFLRSSDGTLFMSGFHFCTGEYQYFVLGAVPGESVVPDGKPADIQQFIQRFGKQHDWNLVVGE
jgi:hypothetical protein